MNNDKLELEVGVPVTVTFSFNVGKLCAKQWPGAEDCYARQSNDGRVLFFDAVEEMRLRKAVRAGQAVILCREKTQGGSNAVEIALGWMKRDREETSDAKFLRQLGIAVDGPGASHA